MSDEFIPNEYMTGVKILEESNKPKNTPNTNILYKCTRCQKEKEYTEFNKNSREKTGLNRYCKVCAKEKNKERYEKNLNLIRYKNKRWKDSNRERFKEYKKRYYKLKKLKEQAAPVTVSQELGLVSSSSSSTPLNKTN